MRYHFDGFPSSSHPMAILSAMINASSCYHPTLLEGYDEERFVLQAARLLAKTRTIAAFSYRKLKGLPIVYPQTKYQYTANFMHMMFSRPDEPYELNEKQVRALDLIFLLHADHEQNCSTSTVRMVASSQANLFASAAAGVCALWGPLHGGANQGVIEQLQQIYDSDYSISDIIAQVKDRKRRLMGFGHRVYKNYDPRARIIKTGADSVLEDLNYSDPLLDIARELEDVALNDDFFTERKLYPNVDFYSGIIMRALGIPLEFFTVMFAIGRMPGWIANFREVAKSNSPIYRPRQIYTGPTERDYVPMAERG
jgi:citrate synthase